MLLDALSRPLGGLAALALLAGCASSAPDPTGRANPEMASVLTAYQNLGVQPIADLTPAEARAQPSPADAAMIVERERTGRPAEPIPVAEVTDLQYEGAAGPLPARLYDPAYARGDVPLILYIHGGGWVIADLDTYDASARALAHSTGAKVLSIHYRQGPETRFPAAHDDAVAAYRWALANADELGIDPERIALAGESAGGNLAINIAIAARDGGLPMPVHQVLVYPVAGTDTETPSYEETTDAKPLNRDGILWFVENYTNNGSDLADPRLDVVNRANLSGLPPTTIVLAEIDPLRSEGQALAEKLRVAGVPVAERTYPGVTHEFFGLGTVVTGAAEAEAFAAERLRAAFGMTGGMDMNTADAGAPTQLAADVVR